MTSISLVPRPCGILILPAIAAVSAMGSTSLGEQFGQTLCLKRLQLVSGNLFSACYGPLTCR
jgi:hypothetical protein